MHRAAKQATSQARAKMHAYEADHRSTRRSSDVVRWRSICPEVAWRRSHAAPLVALSC